MTGKKVGEDKFGDPTDLYKKAMIKAQEKKQLEENPQVEQRAAKPMVNQYKNVDIDLVYDYTALFAEQGWYDAKTNYDTLKLIYTALYDIDIAIIEGKPINTKRDQIYDKYKIDVTSDTINHQLAQVKQNLDITRDTLKDLLKKMKETKVDPKSKKFFNHEEKNKMIESLANQLEKELEKDVIKEKSMEQNLINLLSPSPLKKINTQEFTPLLQPVEPIKQTEITKPKPR